MSVAFVKEESAETAAETQLPDRAISEHPNLVTEEGLKQLEVQMAAARAAVERVGAVDDVNERRRQLAPHLRDIRYLSERLRTAQVVPMPETVDTVGFGATVTFEREDGRVQSYRIVGEDEADPRAGSISYVSPVARALNGKSVGDVVTVSGQELEITAIA